MKDVIILDIQQYRISASISAGFFNYLSTVSRQDEKRSASDRKPYFLRLRGDRIPDTAHGVRIDKLFSGAASGAASEAKGKAESTKDKKI